MTNKILDEANEIIAGPRQESYGDAHDSHTRIGVLWGALLHSYKPGQPVAPEMVALMMAALKMSRASGQMDHHDSWVDMAAYSGLGGEFAEKSAPEKVAEEPIDPSLVYKRLPLATGGYVNNGQLPRIPETEAELREANIKLVSSALDAAGLSVGRKINVTPSGLPISYYGPAR